MESYSFLKLIGTFMLGLLLTLFIGWSIPSSGTTVSPPALNRPVQPLMDATALAKQGKDLYEMGRFDEAATAWEQAAEAYRYQGGTENHALALSNLSLTYQQLGRWREAGTKVASSLQQLHSVNAFGDSYAQALDIDGHLKFAQGQTQEALSSWKQAGQIYTQLGDKARQIANQLNQAQALQSLGFFLKSEALLEQISSTLKDSNIPLSLKVKGLRNLGDVLRATGKLGEPQTSSDIGKLELEEFLSEKPPKIEDAMIALRISLTLAEKLPSPQKESAKSATLLSLANTQRAIAERNREIKAATAYEEVEECKVYSAEDQLPTQALKFYQQATEAATDLSPFVRVQAQINQLSLLRELQQISKAQDILEDQISPQISKLPYSRAGIYARINLAQSLSCFQTPDRPKIVQILKVALQQAQALNDKRAESNALGKLSHLYEQNQQLPEAQTLTQKALLIAQSINAPYITYRWQWQLGRILAKRAGDEKHKEVSAIANRATFRNSIAAYSEAVETLKAIRSDLLAVNQDVQFSFRDNIEPVYRELLALLLPPQTEDDGSDNFQQNLKRAFYYTESLQVAELEDFFRCGLQNVGIKKVNVSETERDPQKATDALMGQMNEFLRDSPRTAIIYPIIIKDPVSSQKRLAVITKLPGQSELKYHSTSEGEAIDETLRKIRMELEESRSQIFTDDDRKPLETLYQWLIQPFDRDLKKIETVVFIPDSSLRSIPMASLYDGDQYVIDKEYATVIAPSLQLLKSKPHRPPQLNALIAGIQIERTGKFPLLDSSEQIDLIESKLHRSTSKGIEALRLLKVLNNKSTNSSVNTFTQKNLQVEIESSAYNLIHLITHGKFDANLQTTLILTDDSPNEKEDVSKFSFTIEDLANWIQIRNREGASPIDLFILSACQTAAGSSRLVLGMAGIAVKSGANATLAPLWSVKTDAAKEFMGYFYEQLINTPGISLATAVKNAQKSLRDGGNYGTPSDWAAYILVGS